MRIVTPILDVLVFALLGIGTFVFISIWSLWMLFSLPIDTFYDAIIKKFYS
tara:strand:+ start:58 stop:210 length:153 start_codon:yes stop_codon:yes gene_type:complete